MNTTEKGNKLEDQLYDYLVNQLNREKYVFDAYPAELCKVYKKKKYFCEERKADAEFDVVIEVCRQDCSEPHLFVVFECKNYMGSIPESAVTTFSDKLARIFRHNAKGLFVFSSRLQSGAESIARSRRLGIVKFDETGMDVVAERKSEAWTEGAFLQSQIFDCSKRTKSLKFVACSDGRFFGSIQHMLQSFNQNSPGEGDATFAPQVNSIAFLPDKEIRETAQASLGLLKHTRGAVNVQELCALLDLDLTFTERTGRDSDGNQILGSANFVKRSIEVNQHGNNQRERFTIAHEIGHFCLGHDRYLLSDSVVEHDLFIDAQSKSIFNLERLEYQANIFASELLLPFDEFLDSVEEIRLDIGIYDRGFGYIFVDDQKCNYIPYNELLSRLSKYYEVSLQAIEIRLKKIGMVTDRRENSRLRKLGSVGWHHGH